MLLLDVVVPSRKCETSEEHLKLVILGSPMRKVDEKNAQFVEGLASNIWLRLYFTLVLTLIESTSSYQTCCSITHSYLTLTKAASAGFPL